MRRKSRSRGGGKVRIFGVVILLLIMYLGSVMLFGWRLVTPEPTRKTEAILEDNPVPQSTEKSMPPLDDCSRTAFAELPEKFHSNSFYPLDRRAKNISGGYIDSPISQVTTTLKNPQPHQLPSLIFNRRKDPGLYMLNPQGEVLLSSLEMRHLNRTFFEFLKYINTTHMAAVCAHEAPEVAKVTDKQVPCIINLQTLEVRRYPFHNPEHLPIHHDMEFNPITETFIFFHRYLIKSIISVDLIREVALNGSIVWEWKLLDHMDCDSNHYTLAIHNQLEQAKLKVVDCFHPNSVYWDIDEDAIYISIRWKWGFTKIDHASSEIIWSIGGSMKRNLAVCADSTERDIFFFFRSKWGSHDFNKIGENKYVVFWNGAEKPKSWIVFITVYPQRSCYTIDRTVQAPSWTDTSGSASNLPDGNILVAYGPKDSLHILDKRGGAVWSGTTPSWVYRPEPWWSSPVITFYDCSPLIGYRWQLHYFIGVRYTVQATVHIIVNQHKVYSRMVRLPPNHAPYTFTVPYKLLNEYLNTDVQISVVTEHASTTKTFRRTACSHCFIKPEPYSHMEFDALLGETPQKSTDPVVCHQGYICRGIVLPVAKVQYSTATTLIRTIRRTFAITLPIEVWCSGEEDLPTELREKLQNEQGVIVRDIQTIMNLDNKTAAELQSYIIKPIALSLSDWDEVVMMDSDTVLLTDITLMFASSGYKTTGTYFMHDRFTTQWPHPQSLIWPRYGRSIDNKVPIRREQYGTNKEWLPAFISKYRKHFNSKFHDVPYSKEIYHDVLSTNIVDKVPFLTATKMEQDSHVDTPTALQDGMSWIAKNSLLLTSDSYHDMDSSLLFIHKLRQHRTIKILWEFSWDRDIRTDLYTHTWGDKETFWLACEVAGTLYYKEEWAAGEVGMLKTIGSVNHTCGGHAHWTPSDLGSQLLYFNLNSHRLFKFIKTQHLLYVSNRTTQRLHTKCPIGAVRLPSFAKRNVKLYIRHMTNVIG